MQKERKKNKKEQSTLFTLFPGKACAGDMSVEGFEWWPIIIQQRPKPAPLPTDPVWAAASSLALQSPVAQASPQLPTLSSHPIGPNLSALLRFCQASSYYRPSPSA